MKSLWSSLAAAALVALACSPGCAPSGFSPAQDDTGLDLGLALADASNAQRVGAQTRSELLRERGQALTEGSGNEILYYCDPAGSDARQHWLLEGSGDNPEPGCDGTLCPAVTNVGSSHLVDGRIGAGRSFGGDDWVNLGDAGDTDGSPGSVSLWFRRGDSVGGQMLVGRMEAIPPFRGWMLWLDGSNRLSFVLQHTWSGSLGYDLIEVRGLQTFTDTNWHHAVVTWQWGVGGTIDASDVSIVIDGARAAQQTLWNQLTGTIYTGAPMTLGGRPYDAVAVPVAPGTNAFAPRFFNGDIDDVRYFDHALQLQDITALRGTATPSDPRQCGACENACSNGMACSDGVCVPPTCPASLQLYADFEEDRGNLVHVDASSPAGQPVRIMQGSISPTLLNTDGTAPFVAGAYGTSYALRFNGTGVLTIDNAAATNHALGPDAFDSGATISAWIRRESGSNGRAIVGSMRPNGAQDGWMLRVDGSGRLQWQIQSATGSDSMTVNSSAVVALDTWTHVAMTTGPDAASDTHLFVNGVDVTTTTSNVAYSGPPAATLPLVVGGRHEGSSLFIGAIDNLTILGQPLSAAQVAQLARTDSYHHPCAPTWTLACAAGEASCDGLAATGCETDLMPAYTTAPVAHCGACNAPDGNGCDTGMPNSIVWTEHCLDGVDNDTDSDIDCADADCALHPACQTTESLCNDGADNDGDGMADSVDPDCALPAESVCDDGYDNDYNGLEDCEDWSCAYTAACGYFEPENDCTDTADNNGDGLTDCADPTCQWDAACYVPPEDCWSVGDEDGNGLADCLDSACEDEWEICPPATEQDCFDFGDEDQDGLADCSDTDCAAEPGCVAGSVPNGGSCEGPMDCADDGQGSLCLPEFGAGVPGGYCSSWCDLSTPTTSCGAGLVCMPGLASLGDSTITQGLCLAPCRSTAECTSGELCRLLRSGGSDVGWVGPPVCAPACSVHADCVQTNYCDLRSGRCAEPEEDCVDVAGADEDGDGDANAADSDCWGTYYPFDNEVNCVDGIDNDDNGDIDCADAACSWFWRCDPTREHACEDTIDNDGDGNADCADEDCQYNDPVCGFVTGENEAWCAAGNCCLNTIDDDMDGLKDCADPDCMEYGAGTGVCVLQETDCGNFEDDDEDGLADCFDSDCACTGGTGVFSSPCTTHNDCVTGPTGEAPVCLPSGFLSGTGMSCTYGCSMVAPNCPADFACVDMLQAPDQGVCLQACLDDSWCSQPGATCDLSEAETVFSSFLGIAVGTCVAGCQTAGCDMGLVCDTVSGTCVEGGILCGNGLDDDGDGDFDCEDAGCAAEVGCLNRGDGLTGAACASADDCVGSALSSLCLSEADTGSPGGYCSGFCRMGGTDCGGGDVCMPADRGNPFETRGVCLAACDDGSGPACAEGYACLRTAAAPVLAVCARPCQAATDCESGSTCVDFHCEPTTTEHCGNGWDDDGDGLADCADTTDCPVLDPTCTGDCPGAGACFAPVEGVEYCDNGLDDDGNGFTDCEDIACGGVVAWPLHEALGTYELAADCLAGATCLVGFGTPVELMVPASVCANTSLRPPGSRCVSDSQCGGFGAGLAQCVLRGAGGGGVPNCVEGPGGQTVCSSPLSAASGVCALTCDVEQGASTCSADTVCVQSLSGRSGHCLDLCDTAEVGACGADTCIQTMSLFGTGVCAAGCAQDGDCGGGDYCDSTDDVGVCAGPCSTDLDCAGAAVCNTTTGRCAVELCVSHSDEDMDGDFDCWDTDCASAAACAEYEFVCTDGLDDDADGLFDCQDPDCGHQPECNSAGDDTIGEMCDELNDCAGSALSALCEVVDDAEEVRCTGSCRPGADDCGSDASCLINEDGLARCHGCVDDGQCGVGHYCARAHENALGETCLSFCATDEDCASVGGSCDSTTSMCLRLFEICDDPMANDEDSDGHSNCDDSDCWALAECDEFDEGSGFDDDYEDERGGYLDPCNGLNIECEDGLVCTEGACRHGCLVNADCDTGQRCGNGQTCQFDPGQIFAADFAAADLALADAAFFESLAFYLPENSDAFLVDVQATDEFTVRSAYGYMRRRLLAYAQLASSSAMVEQALLASANGPSSYGAVASEMSMLLDRALISQRGLGESENDIAGLRAELDIDYADCSVSTGNQANMETRQCFAPEYTSFFLQRAAELVAAIDFFLRFPYYRISGPIEQYATLGIFVRESDLALHFPAKAASLGFEPGGANVQLEPAAWGGRYIPILDEYYYSSFAPDPVPFEDQRLNATGASLGDFFVVDDSGLIVGFIEGPLTFSTATIAISPVALSQRPTNFTETDTATMVRSATLLSSRSGGQDCGGGGSCMPFTRVGSRDVLDILGTIFGRAEDGILPFDHNPAIGGGRPSNTSPRGDGSDWYFDWSTNAIRGTAFRSHIDNTFSSLASLTARAASLGTAELSDEVIQTHVSALGLPVSGSGEEVCVCLCLTSDVCNPDLPLPSDLGGACGHSVGSGAVNPCAGTHCDPGEYADPVQSQNAANAGIFAPLGTAGGVGQEPAWCMQALFGPGGGPSSCGSIPTPAIVRLRSSRICQIHPTACNSTGTESDFCIPDPLGGGGATCMHCDELGCERVESEGNDSPVANPGEDDPTFPWELDCSTARDQEAFPELCSFLNNESEENGSGSSPSPSPSAVPTVNPNPAPGVDPGETMAPDSNLDPIAMASGHQVMPVVDFSPPGSGPFDMSYSRVYNGSIDRGGFHGHRWFSRLDERFVFVRPFEPDGLEDYWTQHGFDSGPLNAPLVCYASWPGTNCVYHYRQDGSAELYIFDSELQAFVPESGVAGMITLARPVAGSAPSTADSHTYQWTNGRGRSAIFNREGQISVQSDSWGNSLRWCRNSDNLTTSLVENGNCGATNHRFLEIDYGVFGLIRSVKDHTGQGVKFTYNLGVALDAAERARYEQAISETGSAADLERTSFHARMLDLGFFSWRDLELFALYSDEYQTTVTPDFLLWVLDRINLSCLGDTDCLVRAKASLNTSRDAFRHRTSAERRARSWLASASTFVSDAETWSGESIDTQTWFYEYAEIDSGFWGFLPGMLDAIDFSDDDDLPEIDMLSPIMEAVFYGRFSSSLWNPSASSSSGGNGGANHPCLRDGGRGGGGGVSRGRLASRASEFLGLLTRSMRAVPPNEYNALAGASPSSVQVVTPFAPRATTTPVHLEVENVYGWHVYSDLGGPPGLRLGYIEGVVYQASGYAAFDAIAAALSADENSLGTGLVMVPEGGVVESLPGVESILRHRRTQEVSNPLGRLEAFSAESFRSAAYQAPFLLEESNTRARRDVVVLASFLNKQCAEDVSFIHSQPVPSINPGELPWVSGVNICTFATLILRDVAGEDVDSTTIAEILDSYSAGAGSRILRRLELIDPTGVRTYILVDGHGHEMMRAVADPSDPTSDRLLVEVSRSNGDGLLTHNQTFVLNADGSSIAGPLQVLTWSNGFTNPFSRGNLLRRHIYPGELAASLDPFNLWGRVSSSPGEAPPIVESWAYEDRFQLPVRHVHPDGRVDRMIPAFARNSQYSWTALDDDGNEVRGAEAVGDLISNGLGDGISRIESFFEPGSPVGGESILQVAGGGVATARPTQVVDIAYDVSGRLVHVKHSTGSESFWGYSSNPMARWSVRRGRRTTTNDEPLPENLRTSLLTEFGTLENQLVSYAEYDAFGRVEESVGTHGESTHFLYDGYHRPVVSQHSAAGSPSSTSTSVTRFDSRGRVSAVNSVVQASRTHSAPLQEQAMVLFYGPDGRPFASCASESIETCDVEIPSLQEDLFICQGAQTSGGGTADCPRWQSVEHDRSGAMIRRTSFDGRTEFFEYTKGVLSNVLQLSHRSDALAGLGFFRRRVSYSPLGQIVGQTIEELPNVFGSPTNSITRTFAYDQFQRPALAQSSEGQLTHQGFDAFGRPNRTEHYSSADDLIRASSSSWDRWGNQVATITTSSSLDPELGTISEANHDVMEVELVLERDQYGRPLRAAHWEGQNQSVSELVSQPAANATCLSWGADGSLRGMADSTSHQLVWSAHNSRQAADGSVAVAESQSVQLMGSAPFCTQFGWASGGRVEASPTVAQRYTPAFGTLVRTEDSVMTPGQTSESGQLIDTLGRVIFETRPDGALTSMEYDWRGVLVRQSSRFGSDSPGSLEVVREYDVQDATGWTTMTDQDGLEARIQTDVFGRVIRQQVPINSGATMTDTFALLSSGAIERTRTTGGIAEVLVTERDSTTGRPTGLTRDGTTLVDALDYASTGGLERSVRHDGFVPVQSHRSSDTRYRTLTEGVSFSSAVSPTTEPGTMVSFGYDVLAASSGTPSRFRPTQVGFDGDLDAVVSGLHFDSRGRPIASTLGESELVTRNRWVGQHLEIVDIGSVNTPTTTVPPVLDATFLSRSNHWDDRGRQTGSVHLLFGAESQTASTSVVQSVEQAILTDDGRMLAHGFHYRGDASVAGVPNVSRAFGYENDGRLASVVTGYGLDSAGSVEHWFNAFATNPQPTSSALAAHLSALPQNTSNALEFDQHGTLVRDDMTDNGSTSAWAPLRSLDSALPTSLSGDTIVWDDQGRLESYAGLAVDNWAYDDRPLQATLSGDYTDGSGTRTVEYAWDLAGRRRAQRITYEDATVEEFWLDYAGRSLVRERDDDGWQRWWHTAPGDALPIAYTINCDESWDGDDLNDSCAQVPRWLHADDYVPDTPGTDRATYLLIRNIRGDVQALATTDGRIIESYAYGLYGAVAGSTCMLVESSTLCAMDICLMLPQCTERVPAPGQRPVVTSHGNTALWAGVHRDLDTGWDWMGARVYLPELRQFLSRDPAGYSVSFDEWAYTPGDPWNYLDRSGWSPDPMQNPGQGRGGVEPYPWGKPDLDELKPPRERANIDKTKFLDTLKLDYVFEQIWNTSLPLVSWYELERMESLASQANAALVNHPNLRWIVDPNFYRTIQPLFDRAVAENIEHSILVDVLMGENGELVYDVVSHTSGTLHNTPLAGHYSAPGTLGINVHFHVDFASIPGLFQPSGQDEAGLEGLSGRDIAIEPGVIVWQSPYSPGEAGGIVVFNSAGEYLSTSAVENYPAVYPISQSMFSLAEAFPVAHWGGGGSLTSFDARAVGEVFFIVLQLANNLDQ